MQLFRHVNGLQGDIAGVEGEGDGVGELEVHQETGVRAGAVLQLLLDLPDEGDGHLLLKLVHWRVQVQYLHDLVT